jgi:diketogulonate reductase-like aldo/keto reductase
LVIAASPNAVWFGPGPDGRIARKALNRLDSVVDMTDAPEFPKETATLTQGATMPLLGFGTWQIKGDDAVRATGSALEAGYRHLDTATVYRNEGEVGRGLAESGVARDDEFVTTKCPPSNAGRGLETLRASLDLLRTDHVDLWLIHWPGDGSANVDLWRELVEARESGLAREIGVSNFDAALLDEVTEATGVRPAVNQIEWSPLLYDATTVAEHRERDIVLEGYSALRGGTLDHPAIKAVADRLGRTTAQVIIRWHLQHGFVVIPKSVHPERIRSNADVATFELTEDDMATLDALGGSTTPS